jgi:hypothetical protein
MTIKLSSVGVAAVLPTLATAGITVPAFAQTSKAMATLPIVASRFSQARFAVGMLIGR